MLIFIGNLLKVNISSLTLLVRFTFSSETCVSFQFANAFSRAAPELASESVIHSIQKNFL